MSKPEKPSIPKSFVALKFSLLVGSQQAYDLWLAQRQAAAVAVWTLPVERRN